MEELYQSRYTGPEIDRRLGLMAGNFLWIKWSSAFPVVEMLDEPGPYIGIYTGESNDPPDDPAEYQWYLNSGADGQPGPEGPEGPAGPANKLSIGSVQSGTTANATITGTAPEQTLNLVLPKGDTGTGLNILGTYATLTDLQTAVPSPAQGDMYNIGSEAPYHVYMWDTTEPPSAWKDQGILQGPPGQDGAPGLDGADGAPGAGVPTGGAQGQALLKASAADRDTEWGDLPEKATSLTALLDAGDWTYNTDHYEQTIQAAGLETDGYCYIVSAAPASAGEYAKRGVLMQDVTVANTATFHADSAPETDITAYIAKLQEG